MTEKKPMTIIGHGHDPQFLTETVDKVIHALANLQPGDPFMFMAMPVNSDQIQFIGAMGPEDFITALNVLEIACGGVLEANLANGIEKETMQ